MLQLMEFYVHDFCHTCTDALALDYQVAQVLINWSSRAQHYPLKHECTDCELSGFKM